nr:MAG TPA: hypothetical protein [Bacteriophage sp.]
MLLMNVPTQRHFNLPIVSHTKESNSCNFGDLFVTVIFDKSMELQIEHREWFAGIFCNSHLISSSAVESLHVFLHSDKSYEDMCLQTKYSTLCLSVLFINSFYLLP